MAGYPTRRAVSAGGLVIDDRSNGRWVLLIARRNHAGTLLWTLPKGRLEDGEDRETAAIREVREETGLDCRIVDEVGTVDYWFVWRDDRVRYHKYVHYYAMRVEGGSLDARDDEADEVAWFPVKQALERMSHLNERRLVQRYLEQQGAVDAPASTSFEAAASQRHRGASGAAAESGGRSTADPRATTGGSSGDHGS